MKFVIITGESGAGKSRAANILEDIGYYCVDNLPVALIPKFAEFCISAAGRYERVALVTDIRSGDKFGSLFEGLETIRQMGCKYTIVFLEADEDAIIRRYKETRRPHPLAIDGESISNTVLREKAKLDELKSRADYIFNTTDLSSNRLRDMLISSLGDDRGNSLRIEILTFGYKYGVPPEVDLLFDVRFLPNPFYIENLRELSGLDRPVRNYIFEFPETSDFLGHLSSLFEFLLPHYSEEGRACLTVGIGCTGGQHRSTAIGCEVADRISGLGYTATVSHRDIDKG